MTMKKLFVISLLSLNVQLFSMEERIDINWRKALPLEDEIVRKKLELAVEQDVLKQQTAKLRHIDFSFSHVSSQTEIWKAWMKEKVKTEANILRLTSYLALVDAPEGAAAQKS